MKRSLQELAEALQAQLVGQNAEVTGFATDNRAVQPGDVFIAIKGVRADGHDFAQAALDQGAVATLAERPVSGRHLRVENVVDALARMGAYYRQPFEGPVIGVTGSAGKTTTKEFLAAALGHLGLVLKTVGNRNTEYTVPLIWAQKKGVEMSAVVEMSMRGFGQIAHLAAFSRPTIGVITNIGTAHLEAVGSRQGIAQAKAELLDALPADGVSVIPADDDFYAFLAGRAKGKIVSFGGESGAVRLTGFEAVDWARSVATFDAFGESVRLAIPVAGDYMAMNAAAALAAAHVAGVPVREAAEAMSETQLPPMRMQQVAFHGGLLIFDAYNASPAGMAGSLKTLATLPSEGKRRAVLGQMNELGEQSEAAHLEVGQLAANLGLDELCFFGDKMETGFLEAKRAGTSSVMARTMEEVSDFLAESGSGDVTLIKGSRGLELERAVELAGAKL